MTNPNPMSAPLAIPPAKAEAGATIASGGLTPLDHMLQVMRDEAQPEERRDKMAVSAAPYVHAKLAALAVTGKDGGAVKIDLTPDAAKELTDAELLAIVNAGRGG